MRFLHTADWHIGKPLRGRSRMDEYAAALDEVVRDRPRPKVDAVLLAGDVFDSPAPPPEAEKLVYDFLARLLPERIAVRASSPATTTTRAGWRRSRALLEGLRHPRPRRGAPARPGRRRLRCAAATASEEAQVAVLPFVPERKVVDACAS